MVSAAVGLGLGFRVGTSRGDQRWTMAQAGNHPPEIAGRRPRHVEMVGAGGMVKGSFTLREGDESVIWIWGSGDC